MAFSNSLCLTSFLLVLISIQTNAQTPSAPAPGPPKPVSLTALLEKSNQFTTFLRLLNSTQVGSQIQNQINGSTEGMTVFAPTDNAFQNLKSGSLNSLSVQQQIQLVQYHVSPKFYSLSNLLMVPNPVRTQASGQNGGVYGLNFTGQGNQVNVSSGLVETQINNPLSQTFPLAVYQVDRVLLPAELFGAAAPRAAPKSPPAPDAEKPDSTVDSDEESDSPTASPNAGSKVGGFGLAIGLGLLCSGALF
ncbi:Fasciclin-like arabinogalactan protein 6 [Linum grandiflorum]